MVHRMHKAGEVKAIRYSSTFTGTSLAFTGYRDDLSLPEDNKVSQQATTELWSLCLLYVIIILTYARCHYVCYTTYMEVHIVYPVHLTVLHLYGKCFILGDKQSCTLTFSHFYER